ncbi:hypothetical protein [Paenibacillus sp. 7523-1]|uniref:hypothetical protein n=1 Tax=Paenibacillus sp. 7523-1 TaxID=2022550 RepID=UPI000BA67C11|nr:hypothetical protein [Paenibacillus sp. 7523-1]PAD29795.1 hypothetical protein CHH60_19695 [Paenibacillus sp. 7523-1]
MENIVKTLLEGAMPTSSTNVYTVPTGKYAVVKSIIICNAAATAMTIRVIIGGAYVAYNYTLKASDSLVLDELDIPLLEAENITIMGSVAGASIFVTGFERDYKAAEYPYLKSNLIASTSAVTTPANGFDSMIKSIIICNTNGSGTSSILSMTNAWSVIDKKEIKAGDSLILPLPKMLVKNGRQLSFSATGALVYVTVVMEKVGD